MIPYAVYKAVHYLGIFVLVAALGAALGRRLGADLPDPLARRFAVIHGTALFLVLLGGFGMLARLGVDHGAIFPGWVWAKLGVWSVLGGVLFVAARRPAASPGLLAAAPLLAALAGYLAFSKPF